MVATADRRLRLVFMGTAAFAVPSLRGARPGPARAGRGLYAASAAGRARPAARALAGRDRRAPAGSAGRRTPASLRDPAESQAEFADARRRPRGGRRLRPDPAAADPRRRRGSAASTCTHRCCRAGAARRRSSARCWRATPKTGVTIFQMEPALDTGPILAMERGPDHRREHAPSSLHDRAGRAGRAHGRAGGRRARGRRPRARPQPDEGVTYAAKIDKAEGRLDWTPPGRAARAPAARAQPLARLLDRDRRPARCWCSRARSRPAAACRARSSTSG